MQINLDNQFFQAALQKASRILGKPGRLILLLMALGTKTKSHGFYKRRRRYCQGKIFYTWPLVARLRPG